MRHEAGLRNAVLGIIGQNENGAHGWRVKQQFERKLGEFWQLNNSEVYRAIEGLATDALIEKLQGDPLSHRKTFRITDKGRKELAAFVTSPPTDAPRALRQELDVKLCFATAEQIPQLFVLIAHQRAAYMGQLGRLNIQRRRLRHTKNPRDIWATNLLIKRAEHSVRAELTWLDEVTEALKESFPTH